MLPSQYRVEIDLASDNPEAPAQPQIYHLRKRLMRFYRGTSVARQEAEDVVSMIRSQGLKADDGWWTMTAADLKP